MGFTCLLRQRRLICTLLFVFIAAIGIYWSHINQQVLLHEKQLLVSELATAQARVIERRLERSLSATRILALEVRQQGGIIKDFEGFADAVLVSTGGVANLQLAPDGVIAQIHPLAGNEKAIGHNLLLDDKRNAEARAAIRERRLTLAGPFELIQGGVAIIGRNPVFIEQAGEERFWGFVSALIYLDDILAVTELETLAQREYGYQLSRIHPDTGALSIVASAGVIDLKPSHTSQLNVPNATWMLKISHAPDGTALWEGLGYGVSVLVAVLISLAVNTLLAQPEKLRRIVAQKTAELQTLAFHDALTGLANRRLLYEHLEQTLHQSARQPLRAALLYLDLDDFKRINDLMGHDVGDRVLQQVAQRLSEALRNMDIVARLGGDEFAVLLQGLDQQACAQQAGLVANKLITVIEKPLSLEGKTFTISASIGITLMPVDGDSVDALLRNADMAMYEAKRSGGKRSGFFDKRLQEQALAKIVLDDELAVAIREQQFVLHYQPIYGLESREVISYEALVRWNHPTAGLVYPDHFISQAEASDHIRGIGYWVVREACGFIQANLQRSGHSPRVAINLSPRQFMDPQLSANIQQILHDTAVEARYLELEVTESSLMDNLDSAIETLTALRAMGMVIAIDDFGTGYSSLSMLKQLPVDKLKIDRSFVKDMDTDRSDQRIARALIFMAHTLQLTVVAEGIETGEQEKLLQRYGCDSGQGYLFSKPMPVEKLEQGVAEDKT